MALVTSLVPTEAVALVRVRVFYKRDARMPDEVAVTLFQSIRFASKPVP
jgi:hypothetical protein